VSTELATYRIGFDITVDIAFPKTWLSWVRDSFCFHAIPTLRWQPSGPSDMISPSCFVMVLTTFPLTFGAS